MQLEQIRKELRDIRYRISFYGEETNGFTTYHEHPTNGSDVLVMVSDNELIFKYECYLPEPHESIMVIYLASITDKDADFRRHVFHSIKSETDQTKRKYRPEEFFDEINRLVDSIEKDPSNLTYYTGYKLYKEYVKFRNQVDSGAFEIYDWENDESLLDGFNQELWENAEEDDQLDINMDAWIELNSWYEKSDRSKLEFGTTIK